MKKTLLVFFATLCAIISTYSQSITGTYSNRWEAPTGEGISYTLTLKPDGTFVFYVNQTYFDNSEKTTKAYGTWETNNHLLVLTTQTEDETSMGLIKDLNNNKARYHKVSERKKLNSDEKSSLKFYQSNVFYVKNMELFKMENIVSSVD